MSDLRENFPDIWKLITEQEKIKATPNHPHRTEKGRSLAQQASARNRAQSEKRYVADDCEPNKRSSVYRKALTFSEGLDSEADSQVAQAAGLSRQWPWDGWSDSEWSRMKYAQAILKHYTMYQMNKYALSLEDLRKKYKSQKNAELEEAARKMRDLMKLCKGIKAMHSQKAHMKNVVSKYSKELNSI